MILTGSGVIQEEFVGLGNHLLILRENTERPETILSGNAILVGLNSKMIFNTVKMILTDPTFYEKYKFQQWFIVQETR